MTQQTIPVVNLSDYHEGGEARARFVETLGDALKACGFVAVEGHGVATSLIHENYELFKRFFALDLEAKKQLEAPQIGRQRGYTSFGVEHARDSAKPDLKEFFHLGRQDAGPALPQNLWPEEPAELQERASALFDAMERCALTLLEAISQVLGQPADFLPSLATGGNSVMRVIHYPVCEGFDEPGVMRAAAHEDINLITLLPESTESGLELLTRDGQWLPIHAIPGQMIVDTGDMMNRITNGVLPATTHRVVNPKGTPTARYSMPFFMHPRPEVSLAALPSCVPAGEAPKHPAVTAQQYLTERLRETGVK